MSRSGDRPASVTTAPISTGTSKALGRPVVSVSQKTKVVGVIDLILDESCRMNPGDTPSRTIDTRKHRLNSFGKRAQPGSVSTSGPDAGGGTFASGSVLPKALFSHFFLHQFFPH